MMIEEYIQQVKSYKNKKMYIYGAGKGARILYQVLNENGISIDGFCVTNIEENKNVFGDGMQTIYQFDKLQFDTEDTLFLIGVVQRGENKIKKYLLNGGVRYALDAPEDLLGYDTEEMSRRAQPAMEITPIIGCSVNCHYCPQALLLSRYYSVDKLRQRKMSFNDFKVCLNKLPKDTIIYWAGFVEPFLNSDVIDMMEYTQECGFDQMLYTTLVGLTMEGFDRVRRIPFKEVVLHTPDIKEYANIPRTKQYMDLLKEVLCAVKPDGTPFINGANCQSAPHPDILGVTEGKLKIYGELMDRAGNLAESTEGDLVKVDKRGKLRCERSLRLDHNILLPDGSVVLCCNDYGLQHVLGNLLKDDYAFIMNDNAIQQIRRALDDEGIPVLCRKCAYAVQVNS